MNPTSLKTGDILHCSGKKLLSRLIKKATKSKFSHSAVFIEIWGQPYILDAQKDGVNVRPLNDWLEKYNYNITVHRSSNLVNEKTFAQRALTKVGHTAYDFESLLIRQPIELLTGKWVEKGDTTKAMYCSEYIAWIYGVEKAYKFSPQDLYEWCKANFFYEIVI
jgi:uncharacterized protein YycO